MYAKVLVDIANTNVDRLFTYRASDELALSLGQRVLVPFGAGNKKTEGFVLDISDACELKGIQLKSIIRVLEPYPVLNADQIKLAYWIKDNYKCLLSQAIRLMIPARLRGGRIKEKTVRIVKIADGIDADVVRSGMLKKDGGIRSPKQAEVFELLSNIGTQMSIHDICAFIPNASPAIAALINKGIITETNHITFRNPYSDIDIISTEPLCLFEEQKYAYDAICRGMDHQKGVFLLHGVTGSGKTEVYMQAIAKAIAENGKAIMLVPEIALTPQTVERIKGRFGGRVAVLHSRLSAGERYDEWRRVLMGSVDVVVGARSAIFAPIRDLRISIIDEEHEMSYTSEQTPRYNASEVAIYRAKLCGAVVVLGSATPKLESYLKAQRGKYTLLTLKHRINSLAMPNVKIVDMRNEFALGNNSIFSDTLAKSLKHCIMSGDQAILFINRRGYSTFVSCRSCGYVFKCPNCDVSLVYHKNDSRMRCHYCGHSERLPKLCPQCAKPYIKYFGVGTEQVEEQLKSIFKGVTTLRMDTDTTRTKNSHYDILSRFYKGDAQVLIGTQMVAKGLDIKNVTLVGVIAADASLFHSDYRSAERTFQLLTQVAGRAGRDSKCGEVVIQTYCPEHTAVLMAAKHDYEGFYNKEIAVRRASMFPPFSMFLRLLFVGSNEERLSLQSEGCMIELEKVIKWVLENEKANAHELLLMYASPAPIKRREGLFRYHLVIKLARTKHTGRVIDAIYEYLTENPKELLFSIEINPNDML